MKVHLIGMKKTHKIDPAILECITKLMDILQRIKLRWVKVKNSDGFYFYQAVRNAELILDKMKKRLENFEKTNDDLKIIRDSLIVLGPIDKILDITQTSKINERQINDVLEKTRDMRSKATIANMIESLEDDKNRIGKSNTEFQFSDIMKRLDTT